MIVVSHYRTAQGDSSAAQLAGGLALRTIEALDGWTTRRLTGAPLERLAAS
jgi:hypothetical protein